jgi:hypothetical protein
MVGPSFDEEHQSPDSVRPPHSLRLIAEKLRHLGKVPVDGRVNNIIELSAMAGRLLWDALNAGAFLSNPQLAIEIERFARQTPPDYYAAWADGCRVEKQARGIAPGLGHSLFPADCAHMADLIEQSDQGPFRAGNREGDEISGQEAPTLNDTEENALLALLELGCLSGSTLAISDTVSKKAGYGSPASGTFKHTVAGLTRRKLIASKSGKGGGIWLSSSGQAEARRIQRKRY